MFKLNRTLIALSLAALTATAAAQDLKPYKNALIRLKTHENAFGAPTFSTWDNRKIHSALVTAGLDGTAKINGSFDWRDAYLIPQKQFEVKDIELDKKRNSVVLKLQATTSKVGTELNLEFTPASDFPNLWKTIVFHNEDAATYRDQQAERIFRTQIAPKFREVDISERDKRELMADLMLLAEGGSGRVEIEATSDGVFAQIPAYDSNSYNTAKVDKNQRLATTIGVVLSGIKRDLNTGNIRSAFLAGYVFSWPVAFRNFVSKDANRFNQIELRVSRSDFADYVAGKLSAFELVKASNLRVDDEKYTLTTWEPAL